jgi:hypothetical protein
VCGIGTRAKGTLDALFSERLWKNNAMLTEEGSTTLWDRAALFAVRGAFTVGESDTALRKLTEYPADRLTGSHIPYPYEAFPEGNRKHLSGESVLYMRIYTEGLMGMRFTAFDRVEFTPMLPKEWDYFKLVNLHMGRSVYDAEARRDNGRIIMSLVRQGVLVRERSGEEGSTFEFML